MSCAREHGRLVASQRDGGTWEGEFGPDVDTCFALLFLRRANLAKDLTASLREARRRFERGYIADVLEFTKGKKSKAAQILGISRKTLLEKRKRYGME